MRIAMWIVGLYVVAGVACYFYFDSTDTTRYNPNNPGAKARKNRQRAMIWPWSLLKQHNVVDRPPPPSAVGLNATRTVAG